MFNIWWIFSLLFRYYTSPGNSRINLLSQWSTDDCEINIVARINGLPSLSQYDYRIGLCEKKTIKMKIMFILVCQQSSCLLNLDQYSAFIWIYFQILSDNQTCSSSSIHGTMIIQSTGKNKSLKIFFIIQR